jgi:CheY-specific phosphatase CheX
VERGLAAQIEFAGPVSGTLMIAAPRALCADLTADLLALDADEVADEQTADALKELANIICGQLATALCGEEPVVRLSIPQVFPLGAGGWRELAQRGGGVHLLVEDRPMVLNLAIR